MAKRSQMVRAGSRLIRWTSQSLLIVLGAVLVTLAVYHHPTCGPATVVDHRTMDNSHHVAHVSSPAMPPPPPPSPPPPPPPSPPLPPPPSPLPPPPPPPLPSPACDLFSGHWVFDNLSYPLYKDRECRFMIDDLACEKYGRKDLSYQHWRWQPHGCDLPRFNAKALLERLRGKRLVFVGDSINRNQWVSMMCLLESSIPGPFKRRKSIPSLYTFKATEYNVSIDFYWSPLLVESNADNPSNHSFWDQIVRIKSIKKHARHWGDADILVFNSYLWWRTPKLKLLEGSFDSPNKAYKEVKALRCYKMALKTLSNWLDINVNRSKMQLFYVSMPATHYQAEQWGMQRDQTCLNENNPISIQGFRGNHGSDPRMIRAVEAMVSKLQKKGLKMQMLKITQLSGYRKDGHPSIYRKLWRPLTKKQLSDPRNYADCTHWCLPGVPDVWNELLQSYILQN